MANKVYNLSGGLYSGDAFTAFESDSTMSNTTDLNGAVANSYSYQVSAGTGMTLKINPGSAIISNGVGSGIRVGSDSENTVTVSAASTANPRVDSVVMYIDNSVASSTSVVDNVDLGILKFAVVAGTPAASPSAPTTSAIQTAIGAGNPYMLLADIEVPKSATAASSFGISDKRKTSVESLLHNVRPESDTPAGWQKAIGDKKHATIWYDMKDCFAAQPSQWGLLTIDCAGSNVVLQSWKQTGASTPELRRTGNTAGKWNSDFHGVTSSMIDWTTLRKNFYHGTKTDNTALTTNIQYFASTDISAIPDNTVCVAICKFKFGDTGGSGNTVSGAIYNQNTTTLGGSVFYTNLSWGSTMTTMGVFTKSSSITQARLGIKKENSSIVCNINDATLIVIPVTNA